MVYLLPFQLLNTNISVNTFSFMNDTNLIERCQAEEGGVRDQTGRLQIQTGGTRLPLKQKILNLSTGTSAKFLSNKAQDDYRQAYLTFFGTEGSS